MDEDRPALTELTDKERVEAMKRFRVLQPFLQQGVPLARAAREHRVPIRTAWRWVKQYASLGLPDRLK